MAASLCQELQARARREAKCLQFWRFPGFHHAETREPGGLRRKAHLELPFTTGSMGWPPRALDRRPSRRSGLAVHCQCRDYAALQSKPPWPPSITGRTSAPRRQGGLRRKAHLEASPVATPPRDTPAQRSEAGRRRQGCRLPGSCGSSQCSALPAGWTERPPPARVKAGGRGAPDAH